MHVSKKTQEMSPNHSRNKEPFGSVLVLGGGISGMQSALDLANSGYYVYLVEKSSGSDVAAGQDLSHQRLLHVNYLA